MPANHPAGDRQDDEDERHGVACLADPGRHPPHHAKEQPVGDEDRRRPARHRPRGPGREAVRGWSDSVRQQCEAVRQRHEDVGGCWAGVLCRHGDGRRLRGDARRLGGDARRLRADLRRRREDGRWHGDGRSKFGVVPVRCGERRHPDWRDGPETVPVVRVRRWYRFCTARGRNSRGGGRQLARHRRPPIGGWCPCGRVIPLGRGFPRGGRSTGRLLDVRNDRPVPAMAAAAGPARQCRVGHKRLSALRAGKADLHDGTSRIRRYRRPVTTVAARSSAVRWTFSLVR